MRTGAASFAVDDFAICAEGQAAIGNDGATAVAQQSFEARSVLGRDGQVSVQRIAGTGCTTNGLFFTEPSISAGYRWYVGDQLITVSAGAQSRFRPTLPTQHYFADPRTQWVNTNLSASARYVSRDLWIGRMHVYGGVTWRKNDLDNSYAELGSDTGLRGYANAQFRGQNVIRFNAEYRTLPLNIWTFHAGAVVFYDGGAAFGGIDPADGVGTIPFIYHQSLGAGIRGVFPQFDRETFRLDFGIPLSSQPGSVGTWITFSLGQVF